MLVCFAVSCIYSVISRLKPFEPDDANNTVGNTFVNIQIPGSSQPSAILVSHPQNQGFEQPFRCFDLHSICVPTFCEYPLKTNVIFSGNYQSIKAVAAKCDLYSYIYFFMFCTFYMLK